MPDALTKKQRSYCMSQVRSKWTSQEKKIHNYLKGNKIRHIMHPKISGNPDILLTDKKAAIFMHGCFWHKCRWHYRMPKTNKKYWNDKIGKNVRRDKNNIAKLRKSGFKVLVIWEHESKHPEKIIDKIKKSF